MHFKIGKGGGVRIADTRELLRNKSFPHKCELKRGPFNFSPQYPRL